MFVTPIDAQPLHGACRGMSDPHRLIEQRLLRRKVIELLATPLEGVDREQFLAQAEERMKRQLPAPGRDQMRRNLSIVRD